MKIKLLVLSLLGVLEDEFDEEDRQRPLSYQRGKTHASCLHARSTSCKAWVASRYRIQMRLSNDTPANGVIAPYLVSAIREQSRALEVFLRRFSATAKLGH